VTCVCVTGTVPVSPEARRSLKSDRPSQPSERQKRITVGWLTEAARAISATGSFNTERGWASTWSATRRSAGERFGRARWIWPRIADAAPPVRLRSCAARIAETPWKVASSAVMTQVGICARYAEKRPLSSKRARNGERSKCAPRRGTMPPPM
jgi:hypothetical protein